MGFFRDIFLTKQDKQVVDVYNSIRLYWKNTNDFVVAHIRYMQDLNHKYKLGFKEKVITDLPYIIITPLLQGGFSQINTMFIFSQYVVFYILRHDNPKIYRYSDENLISIAENLGKVLIPYNSKVTPEYEYQIDKTIDVIARFGNKNVTPKEICRNSANREISMQILSKNAGCLVSDLRELTYNKLSIIGSSNNASAEAIISSLKEIILKYNNARFEMAEQYGMHPNDTPASIMIELIEDYIEEIKSKKNSSDEEVEEMFLTDNDIMTQLMTAQIKGDTKHVNQLIKENPEFLMRFLKKMAEKEEGTYEEDDLPF